MVQKIVRRTWNFDSVPADDPDWSPTVTNSATITRVADGWRLALTDDDEAQLARIDFDGLLKFDPAKLLLVKMILSVTSIPAAVNVHFGLSAAHNATANDITARVFWNALGGTAVGVRVDDSVVDTGQIPTTFSLVPGTKAEFVVDYAGGLQTQIPSHLSRRGKDALVFYASTRGTLSQWNREGVGLLNYFAGLQPYIRLDKASGTAEAALTIHQVEIDSRL